MVVIRVPRSIKIGGHNIRIVYNRDLAASGERARIDWNRLVISVHPDKAASVKGQGLLHEFVHGVDTIYLNRQIEREEIIDPLAEGLWQILEQLGVEFVWDDIDDETRRE